MNEQEVRKIIQEEIAEFASKSQFGVQKVVVHSHNGTDSLRVDADNLVFSVPYFRLFQATTTPTVSIKGAIAAVNGVLEIYNGTNWVKVSSQ